MVQRVWLPDCSHSGSNLGDFLAFDDRYAAKVIRQARTRGYGSEGGYMQTEPGRGSDGSSQGIWIKKNIAIVDSRVQ